ncbi:MAG: hypothetical protein H6Q10_2315 [Acidobacteria bacterium]|jgi:uncharacterized protein (TIGR02246 family)|nr:hypothetical protein [Acidobacteriota bacterium]
MRYALALLVACVLLVPIAAPAQGTGDEATIRKNVDMWVQQYNTHDAAGLAKWYKADSVYLAPGGEIFIGPDAVQKYFEHSFQQSPKSQIAVQLTQLKFVRPDLAVGHGTFEVTNLVMKDGTPLPMKGPWVTTFVKQDGQWAPLAHGASMMLPKPVVEKR